MSDFETSKNYVMNTYNRFPIVLEKGEGMYVYDDKGKKYLDFVAGIAVNSLGHANEKLCAAITEQSKQLIHVSNLYWTKPQLLLAEKLVKNSGFDKVFFCNSGAEAIEGTLKLSRKYADKNKSGKYEIIAMKNSFHGRTYGAISVTGQMKYQQGLSPLLPGIKHIEYNNFDELQQNVSDKTCAILVEPVQGEGGIHPATKEFLKSVRELCDNLDIMLIYDEVQCGVGRTGKLFAYENFDVCPDVLVLAKGIAGGVPMGVILAKEKFTEAFSPGDHASTFGGNPLAASSANIVIDELLSNGLLENIQLQGTYLTEKLLGLKSKYPMILDVRGLGLMQGIELNIPVAPIITKCMENGLLLVNAGVNVIRFVPPLIVKHEHIDEAIKIIESTLSSYTA